MLPCILIPNTWRMVTVLVLLMITINVGWTWACETSDSTLLVPIRQVVDRFNTLVQQRGFVGQERAIERTRTLLMQIEKGKAGSSQSPVVIHYVGPSGTGKTMLAEIVAESLVFAEEDCKKGMWGVINSQLGRRTCKHVPVQNACGVVARALQSQQITGNEVDGEGFIRGVMEALAKELARRKSDGNILSQLTASASSRDDGNHNLGPRAVLILDDFNLCKGKCQRVFAQALNTGKYHTQSGSVLSLGNVVIVITSDLSDEDLRLHPGDDLTESLRLIRSKVRECWGSDSSWAELPDLTIPLFPFNDAEIKKILEHTFEGFKLQVRENVEQWLKDEEKKVTGEVTWKGMVYISNDVYDVVTQEMFNKLARVNARAFSENLKPKLINAIRNPIEVGERLVKEVRPEEGDVDPPSPLVQWASALVKREKSVKIAKWKSWPNDIYLEIAPETNDECSPAVLEFVLRISQTGMMDDY